MAVRNVLRNAVKALRMLDLPSEAYGTIEMALAEAMNNIVEHAYADIPNGVIQLEIVPCADGLHCKLTDDGHQMPDGNLPSGDLMPLDCEIDDLPEGGFGWFLIRELTRDLQYCRRSGKNILSFRISIEPAQNPAN